MWRVTSILASVLLLVLAASLVAQTVPSSPPATTAPAETDKSPTVVIPVTGTIDDYTRDHLVRRIEAAQKLGAQTVVLSINTYGGVVTSALDISRHLKSLPDSLRTVAFVNDKAISAGALIALACDEIAMTPQAVIGDCAPIAMTGQGLAPMPAAERAKAESPILADFRDSSVRHGYDPLLTAAMVSVGHTVHYVQKDGERKFVDEPQYAALSKDGWTPVPDLPNPVDGPGTLLTIHGIEAEKLGLARSVAPTTDALASLLNLNVLTTLSPSPGERLVDLLGSAAVRGLLLVIFMQSLYLSLHTPGHGAPEAVATVSLGLLLGVPMLTGYAQWYEIVMILGGLALVAFEVFVFPGHLVSAVTGLILIILGFVLTFVPKEPTGLPGILPSLETTYRALQTGLTVTVASAAVSLVLSAVIAKYLPSVPYFNRLVLPTGDPAASPSPATAPFAPIVGDFGTAVTPLRPGGSASFPAPEGGAPDQIVSVVCDCGFVPAGTPVVVQETTNNRILVRPATQARPATA